MSEYVELKCLTCKERTSLNLNRGWEHVQTLLACRTEAAALAVASSRDAATTHYIFDELPQWMVFFGHHPAPRHEVVVESEYGRRPGECGWLEGDEVCALAPKHDGAHGYRRRN